MNTLNVNVYLVKKVLRIHTKVHYEKKIRDDKIIQACLYGFGTLLCRDKGSHGHSETRIQLKKSI